MLSAVIQDDPEQHRLTPITAVTISNLTHTHGKMGKTDLQLGRAFKPRAGTVQESLQKQYVYHQRNIHNTVGTDHISQAKLQAFTF